MPAKAKARCGLGAEACVHSCYEAGRDGFWLHRWLIAQGIDNMVVDSASIEVNRRARRVKTDRLDGDKLLAMLIRYRTGERRVWSVVRVPTPEQEVQFSRKPKAIRFRVAWPTTTIGRPECRIERPKPTRCTRPPDREADARGLR